MTTHDPRRAKALALRAQGVSVDKIIKQVRAGTQTVRAWLRDAGMATKDAKFSSAPIIRNPIQSLAAAVIEYAEYDAFTAVVHSQGDGVRKGGNVKIIFPEDRAQARHFLLDTDGEWARARAFWCDVLGIDPGVLRECMLRKYRERLRGALVALLLLAAPAAAHQAPAGWEYDRECCDMQDCAQVADPTIREVAGGYEVVIAPGQHPLVTTPVRAFIPHGSAKIRVSGDEHKHACVSPYGHVFCIYVPPGGV